MIRNRMNLVVGFVNSGFAGIEKVNNPSGFGYKVNGPLLAQKAIESYFYYGFNVTFILSENGMIGNNGTYTGLFKLLQDKIIDESMFPIEVGTAIEVANFDNIAGTGDMIITSLAPPTKRYVSDVIRSLNGFSTDASLTILISLLLWFIFLKLTSTMQRIIDYVSLLFQQNFATAYNWIKRLHYFLALCFVFFLFEIEMANFSAELTVVVKPVTIDTLEDVLKTGTIPVFHELFHMHESFRDSDDKTRNEIWKSLQKNGGERNIITLTLSTELARMVSGMFEGKYCYIIPRLVLKLMPEAACFFCEDFVMKTREVRFYASPAFDTKSYGNPQRRNLEYDKRNALRDYHTGLLEVGFYEYGQRDFGDLLKSPRNVYDCCLTFESKPEANEFVEMQMLHFKITLSVTFLLLTMATLLVVSEIQYFVSIKRNGVVVAETTKECLEELPGCSKTLCQSDNTKEDDRIAKV